MVGMQYSSSRRRIPVVLSNAHLNVSVSGGNKAGETRDGNKENVPHTAWVTVPSSVSAYNSTQLLREEDMQNTESVVCNKMYTLNIRVLTILNITISRYRRTCIPGVFLRVLLTCYGSLN